jgi:hypothetical protein
MSELLKKLQGWFDDPIHDDMRDTMLMLLAHEIAQECQKITAARKQKAA